MEELRADLRMIVDREFLRAVGEMKDRGMTEEQVADYLDISVSRLRSVLAIIKNELNIFNTKKIEEMHNNGASAAYISMHLDIPMSFVRSVTKKES